MTSPQATVPISLINGFLAAVSVEKMSIDRFVARAGISQSLLGKRGARVTQVQFATLYRMLAVELDDEMAGIFSRPLRNGFLKYLCLSLLDASTLEVAMHRFGQFFHLILDDVEIESSVDTGRARIAVVKPRGGHEVSVLGMELMLKLAHGVASWLVAQKIPLLQVEFDFTRPAHASDYLYLFPGPVQFNCAQTSMQFDASYFALPIRQRKSDLRTFLARAPEDWIFTSFSDQVASHRVRQYLESKLPEIATVDVVAHALHYSARTLARRLGAEGTTFQAVKDELRRDIAIQRLTTTDDALASIAFDIGFDDPTAFHRAFRHWTGSTPSAYRDVSRN
nr:AraC family transcriptional regulator [Paraburkholderia aspalathi]